MRAGKFLVPQLLREGCEAAAPITSSSRNDSVSSRKSGLSEQTPPTLDLASADRQHPLLKGVALADRLGSPNSRGGAMVTKGGLVFIGGGDGYLYAFDRKSGKEVWRGRIPYQNTAVPMTYRTRSGRQFVVAATGSGANNALVAFALGQ